MYTDLNDIFDIIVGVPSEQFPEIDMSEQNFPCMG